MDSIKIFIVIVGSSLEIILGLIYFFLIRIFFNIDIVGYYGAIISFFATLAFITDLGFSITHLKYYPESKNSEEEAKYNGTLLLFKLIQFLIFLIVNLSLIPVIPLYTYDIRVKCLILLSTTFILTAHFFQPLFYSKKEVFKYTFTIITSSIFRVLLLFITITFFENDIWLLSYVLLISNLSFFIINLILLRKTKFQKPPFEYLKKYLNYTLPFFITTSLVVIVTNIDVLFLSAWFPVDDVANYYTAKQFYTYVFIFINGVSNILVTTFSKNVSIDKNDENLFIIQNIHKFLNLAVIPIVMIIMVYLTDYFVFIFGENYRLTGIVLSIMSLTLISISVNIANNSQLQALGKVKFLAIITIFENTMTIFLLIFFIFPGFLNLGALGGALAMVTSSIIIQLITRPIFYIKYNLKFYYDSFRNIAIMICIIVIQLSINNFIQFSFYIYPLFMLLDLSLYLLLNFITKGISKEDIKFFLSILNLKNIKKIIALELKNDN